MTEDYAKVEVRGIKDGRVVKKWITMPMAYDDVWEEMGEIEFEVVDSTFPLFKKGFYTDYEALEEDFEMYESIADTIGDDDAPLEIMRKLGVSLDLLYDAKDDIYYTGHTSEEELAEEFIQEGLIDKDSLINYYLDLEMVGRDIMIDGEYVQLSDGRIWGVPI